MNEWKRGDSVSVSEVMIKSTENGPKPGHRRSEGCSGLVPVRRIHPHALLRRNTQEKRIYSKNTRGQASIEKADGVSENGRCGKKREPIYSAMKIRSRTR